MEFPVNERNNGTFASVGEISGTSTSGYSSTLSSGNESFPFLPAFRNDEAMEGYDLELFGLRWKFQNVSTMFANEIRTVQVLVPYDNNGLPNFFPLSEESNNGQVTQRESLSSQYGISDLTETDTEEKNGSGSSSDGQGDSTVRLNGSGSGMLQQPTLERVQTLGPQNSMVEQFAPQIVRREDFEDNHPAVDLHKQMARQEFEPVKNDTNNFELAADIIPLQNQEYKFVCQFCTIGFQQRYKWKNHIKIHLGRTTYNCTCSKCGIPYRDYRTMRKHHNERYKN